ncbi:MAG: hypothetical protein QOK29_1398, partial [Rhodospirillaceae bacterium]|nr:hypothetical protein [Rhodospirillaceae bacterium]
TPVPVMIAVGVAKPSAQGQAMTSTATALMIAVSTEPPEIHQAPDLSDDHGPAVGHPAAPA